MSALLDRSLSIWHRQFALRFALCLIAVGLLLQPATAHADRWASEPPSEEEWVATQAETILRAAPATDADRLAVVRPGTALRVLSPNAGWTQVFDPRTDTTAFVRGDLLAPDDPPSEYLYLEPPPLETELNTIAIATGEVPLYLYPRREPEAVATILNPSRRESVVGAVTGDDGEIWYQTADAYYLPRDGVFLSSAPHEFDGRWLDVSLSGVARVVAYEGGVAVRSFKAIKGTARFPTPIGAWSIVRRVANETMDSATIGIPRNSRDGYLLKNVLYTQYFLGTGESLHYNWWSSAWGAPGSKGCLGLSLADARWLWDWATIGTPVLIHN